MAYARLLLDVEDVPSGSLIYILYRAGSTTEFLCRATMRRYVASLGDKSILFFPSHGEILNLISDHVPVSIHWSTSSKSYRIVNFAFGHAVVEKVPKMKNGKKVGVREARYTKHVDISAPTFEQAAIALFFATLGGKLCRRYDDERFEYIRWDNYERRFKTEIK